MKKINILKNFLIYIFALIIVFGAFPFYDAYKNKFAKHFDYVKPAENFSGGKTIAIFNDPPNDLIRPINYHFISHNQINELDFLSLRISKLEFSKLSALDMPTRINFIFTFNAPLMRTYNKQDEYSLPLIYLLIDSPYISHPPNKEDPLYKLNGPDWDFKIVIGGHFKEAQIYRYDGVHLKNSLPVYRGIKEPIIYGIIPETKNQFELQRHIIMAAIPIEIIGDMSKGDWNIYAFNMINNPSNPGTPLLSEQADIPSLCDIIYPESLLNINLAYGSRPQILPLSFSNH